MTRHDILCPNAVKRDVGKTLCKSDVIYAAALCYAICTSLNVICFKTSFKAQEVQTFYDFFAKKYFIMDWKIYTCHCLNSYLITLELEEYKHVFNNKNKKTPSLPDTFCVGRSAFIFFFYKRPEKQASMIRKYHKHIL